MPTIDVVSDASVALKWFHAEGEEEVDAARALLDHHRQHVVALSVLDLTPHEIGNALLRGRPRVGAAATSAVLDALTQICARVSLTSTEFAEAATLAEQHGLTLYDAAYAAAAHSRGARLATLDRALLRSGLGQRPSDIISEIAGP